MAQRTKKTQRILERLTGDDDAFRAEGIGIAFDFLMQQNLGELVDDEALIAGIDTVLTEETIEAVVARHIAPSSAREIAWMQESRLTVGDLVPAAVRPAIRDIATREERPKAAWAQDLIDPALIRALVAPIIQDVLLGFAQKIPMATNMNIPTESVPLGAFAGRLRKTVEKRAGGLVDNAKNIMGGIGTEMQRRMELAAREFSEGATKEIRQTIDARLASDEGRALIVQMTDQALDAIYDVSLREIARDADALPLDAVHAVVPKLVAHGRTLDEIRGRISEEIAAFVAAEGARSVGEVVEELGLRDMLREQLVTQASPRVRTLAQTPEFEAWFLRLIEG